MRKIYLSQYDIAPNLLQIITPKASSIATNKYISIYVITLILIINS